MVKQFDNLKKESEDHVPVWAPGGFGELCLHLIVSFSLLAYVAGGRKAKP